MSRRIVTAMVAVLLAALVAFAVPLGVAVRGLLTSRALDDLQTQGEYAGLLIDEQAATCRQVEAIVRALAGQQGSPALSLFSGTGQLVLRPVDHEPTVGTELARAVQQGVAGRRHGEGSLAVAVPLTTEVCLQPLVLHAQVPDTGLQAGVRRAWGALALVGLAVLGLAALVGRVVAARLARPLRELAGSATALGDGDFSVRVPRSEVEEVDAIAAALDRTAERLGRAVERGRTFAADSSHQLRTPLTALRLQLEALEAGGADPAAVGAALVEADRLEATLDELVALTSLDTVEERIDAETLVAPAVEAARAAGRALDRGVELEVVPSPPVHVRPAAVRQALQVLLDNALQHGAGTVRVRVSPTLPDEEVPGRGARQGMRICVHDEGPGLPASVRADLRGRDAGGSLPVQGGRGLWLARTLVEGEGGRLVADDDGHGRVCLVLPVREPRP